MFIGVVWGGIIIDKLKLYTEINLENAEKRVQEIKEALK